MITKDKQYYQNRINKMINNGKDNSRIVKKLQRKIRSLEK